MNGAVLWLAVTIVILTWLLVNSIRSRRYWINACQKQITKRWQDRLPVSRVQITALLEAHRVRWIPAPNPDRDERMPDVPMHLAECPTCGPMTGMTDTSVHQARVLAIHLNKGWLRTANIELPVHRLEVVISGDNRRVFSGDITFKGVCDAEAGAPCRMWCNDPDCREEAGADHGSHVLVDQGECGVIGTLNADPSMIPELYRGQSGPVRSDFIELEQDFDGVTWCYLGEAASTEAPAACEENCRHRCPACRAGLVTHLECDPRCVHRKVATSK